MISVIVPIYNTAPYLRKCLDSICNQTYSNLQIILVDDGSSDGSEVICDEYANADDRVLVIHQKNSGVSAARNRALKQAKGEWVSFVDSDDWLELNMYEELLNLSRNYDAQLLECDIYDEGIDKHSYRDIWCCLKKGPFLVFEGNERYFYALSYTPVLWNKLISMNVIKNQEFSLTCRYGEDTLFLSEAVLNASRIACTRKPLYHYRSDRQGNVVSSKINDRILDLTSSYDFVANKMLKVGAFNAAAQLVFTAALQVIEKLPVKWDAGTLVYFRELKRFTRKYKRYLSELKVNERTSQFRIALVKIASVSPKAAVIVWNLAIVLKHKKVPLEKSGLKTGNSYESKKK